MEDELSDARLEASKLKTELVSERSAWEVKLSEMQSRMNEVYYILLQLILPILCNYILIMGTH
jgi:hypothetical protein